MIKYILFLSLFNFFMSDYTDDEEKFYITAYKSENYLCSKYNIKMDGKGSSFPEKLEIVTHSFVSKTPIDTSEIRSILINTAIVALKDINSNPELNSILIKYPFEMEGINIDLSVEENNRFVLSPHISFASLFKNVIYYHTYNPLMKKLDEKFSESYQEAYDIVVKEGKLQE